MRIATFFLLSAVLFLSNCRQTQPVQDYEAVYSTVFDSAAVVSAHPLSSEVGLDILKAGGNAVDAAVAVQFALAVVCPRAGNIGGGGFLVYRRADGFANTLDYREKAPAAAYRDMYLDSLGNIVDGMSTRGHRAAGVPGTVAGLVDAHDRYGKLPWAELVAPAIRLAEAGFPITITEAERLNRYADDFREFNEAPNPFLKDTPWQEGDLLRQPELAATLRLIQERGRAGFYAGHTADLIVAEMESGDGLITRQDLLDYRPVWREPLIDEYRQYRVISMPPSSSGGVALLQMLEMIEPYPLASYGFQSTTATHLMVEAERRAYADRAEYLGDMDYYPVPLDSILNDAYLMAKMEDFKPGVATLSDSLGKTDIVVRKESFETTHTSVVDAEGNAVSLTTTLNSNYGCKVMVDGAGFFLNNEMDDFSSKPGVPNQFGLVGAEANAIGPGKRMLSSMTPTIVERDGELYLVLGAPGGSTIITAVFQVFVNVSSFGMPLDSAIRAPRFHHQWLPDEIWVEPTALSPAVRDSLSAMGHHFSEKQSMGRIKAIHRLTDGRLHAGADARNPDDDVAGY
ncbi:MAG: gamma-glutamyltransferase [Lewinella sp.]|nr:gamma-glutamyltransferase [Lewinella sp.]